jgi:hypothetical protein
MIRSLSDHPSGPSGAGPTPTSGVQRVSTYVEAAPMPMGAIPGERASFPDANPPSDDVNAPPDSPHIHCRETPTKPAGPLCNACLPVSCHRVPDLALFRASLHGGISLTSTCALCTCAEGRSRKKGKGVLGSSGSEGVERYVVCCVCVWFFFRRWTDVDDDMPRMSRTNLRGKAAVKRNPTLRLTLHRLHNRAWPVCGRASADSTRYDRHDTTRHDTTRHEAVGMWTRRMRMMRWFCSAMGTLLSKF